MLGHTNAIVFGGGIGEHSDLVRSRICGNLQAFGIQLDGERNRAANGHEARISAPDSKVELWVVPLDEESQMARAASKLLGGAHAG